MQGTNAPPSYGTPPGGAPQTPVPPTNPMAAFMQRMAAQRGQGMPPGGIPTGAPPPNPMAGIGQAARGAYDSLRGPQPPVPPGGVPAVPPGVPPGAPNAAPPGVVPPVNPALQAQQAAQQRMNQQAQMLQQNPMSGLGMAGARIAALRGRR